MVVVIAYDIPDDRRRLRVMRLLQDHGQRVQKSVYECDLAPRHYAALRARLETLLHPHEDNVRYYPLCRVCAGQVEVRNSPAVAASPSLYLV